MWISLWSFEHRLLQKCQRCCCSIAFPSRLMYPGCTSAPALSNSSVHLCVHNSSSLGAGTSAQVSAFRSSRSKNLQPKRHCHSGVVAAGQQQCDEARGVTGGCWWHLPPLAVSLGAAACHWWRFLSLLGAGEGHPSPWAVPALSLAPGAVPACVGGTRLLPQRAWSRSLTAALVNSSKICQNLSLQVFFSPLPSGFCKEFILSVLPFLCCVPLRAEWEVLSPSVTSVLVLYPHQMDKAGSRACLGAWAKQEIVTLSEHHSYCLQMEFSDQL